MTIVTISRGSYSRGQEVAEKVAERLGFECVAREVLLESSSEHDVPEAKLIRALHDSPSFWDRFGHKKEKYVAYIQAALLRRLVTDDVVYHGLAGQYFLKGISHALKVRIIADLEDRVQVVMARDGVRDKEARAILTRDDAERRKWSSFLYGIENSDPSLYDMVLHIGKLTVDDAADIVCHTVGLDRFKATPESQAAIRDLLLAAEVKEVLVEIKPGVEVSCSDGFVIITVREKMIRMGQVADDLEHKAWQVVGVRGVHIDAEFSS